MKSHASAQLPPASCLLIIMLLFGYVAIGHFNRVGMAVAGTEVFIRTPSNQSGENNTELPVSTSIDTHSFSGVFTETQMGWVYTAFLVVYTIGMLPGGWLIDRIGAAKALALLGLTMGTFVVLTGALGWFANTANQLWLGFVVVRGLAGLGSTTLHPGAAHVVAEVAPLRLRTTANGLVTAGALLGIAFSSTLFGKFIDHWTWQWAFVICGTAMIVYGVVWYVLTAILLRNSSAMSEHRRDAVDPTLVGTSPLNAGSTNPYQAPLVASRRDQGPAMGDRERSANVRALLRDPALYVLTLSYVAYGYFQYLFFYWMGYYFKNELHVPNSYSRQATLIIFLAQGVGMIVGGMLNDLLCRQLGTARGRRVIVLTGMSLSGVLAVLAVGVQEAGLVTLLMALAMGSQGMCEGVFWSTATEIGGKSRGVAGAFMNTGGNVGGFISPVMTAKIAESIGWPGAITVACIICGAGGVLWFWIGSKETA